MVIGILAGKGQSGTGDQDDTVVVPLNTLQRRVTGSRRVEVLSVSMEEGADSVPLKAALRQLLRERRKLAAVSMLVGAIGIMNIMLVSVTERTGRLGCAWRWARSKARCCCSF